jgi:hypothetical protein
MDRKAIVEKWMNKKGKISVKDIQDPFVRENMALILENQECKDWSGKTINEASNAMNTEVSLSNLGYSYPDGAQDSDAWRFRPVAMALFRRVFPMLFANKVVGVQAMSTPVGLAFALRTVYADGNNVEAAWDNVDLYGGYSGNQTGVSGHFDTTTANGFYDSSATGASTSAAEAYALTAGDNTAYPQLKVRLDKVTITAETRKLGASFSLESAQDVKTMQDIDIEKLMIEVLQYETIAELDRQIIYSMKKAAINTTMGGAILSSINCSGTSALDGRWSQERYAGIVTAIVNQANAIAVKTKRGAGNFVVVSPQMATVLQASGHPFTKLTTAVDASNTIAEVGKLNDTIAVYRDVYARTDYTLVGFKGPGINDAGVIFSPYIMGLTSKAIDPNDFSPRVGVMSRYALTDSLLGCGRYYRLLPFSNVASIIPGGANL